MTLLDEDSPQMIREQRKDNPHDYIFAERGSAQWDVAWKALIATGRKPEEYMLMHGTPWQGAKEGIVEWGFKHIDSRQYVHVTVTG